MAWLWNTNSIKYRKNGSTKSLIRVSNPTSDTLKTPTKYLCVRKDGETVKIPMVATSSLSSSTWSDAPWLAGEVCLITGGVKYRAMGNCVNIRINCTVSLRTESWSSGYEGGLRGTFSVTVKSMQCTAKLPAKLVITGTVGAGSKTATNTWTLPANSLESTNSGSASVTWGIGGTTESLGPNHTLRLTFKTDTYNSKSFSGTVFSKTYNNINNVGDTVYYLTLNG